MPQQIINVGATPDNGQGDPLRDAFIKTNNNFSELYNSPSGGVAQNVYYVSKSGNNANSGNSLGQAFLTITRAVEVASNYLGNNPGQRVCIFVKAGDYTESNPIVCPANLTIVGDNLRSVSVRPANPAQDIFQLVNGDYISGITFRDHVSPAAAIAFPSIGAGTITTSPYVQNCSSITTTGCGMRVDGNLAQGLRSMVTDSYTQVNQGGIGIHILNNGYAQLVSIFTICCQQGVLVENGGYCSVTNSNTSFGTFGLVADGKITQGLTGLVNGANQIGNQILINGLSQQPTTDLSLSFDGGITLYDVWLASTITSGQSLITISDQLTVPPANGALVTFYKRSGINASSHTFEWVGTGTNLATALPATGAMPVQANEVVTSNGGIVVYTSTDQRGNFQVGDQLTINGASGTISGDTFNKSLFAVMTPYILALEG